MSQFESDLDDLVADHQAFKNQLQARTQQSLCAPETPSAQLSCEQSALVAPSVAPADVNELLESLQASIVESENSLNRAPYLFIGSI